MERTSNDSMALGVVVRLLMCSAVMWLAPSAITTKSLPSATKELLMGSSADPSVDGGSVDFTASVTSNGTNFSPR